MYTLILRRNALRLCAAAALSFTLSACGGGGGGEVASTPSPPPPPPPPPPPTGTSLNIIDNAPGGVLAVAGASSSAPYSDAHPLAEATIDPGDQPEFRYDAANDLYEIKLPSGAWETLSTDDATLPDWGRVATSPSGARVLLGYDRDLDKPDAYIYSTLVGYSAPGDVFGWLGIGVPTPEAGLPTSGSATFDGIIRGSADYLVDDGWGGVRPSDVVGTVTLSFDFQKSALGGSMEAFLCCNNDISLGIYQFRDTVYSAGKYSGRFDTGLPGLNGFYGQLTGPKAQETVGGWAVPFMIDGDLHEAMGAWVAGRPK